MVVKILYIEDDPRAARMIHKMLSGTGYELSHVTTGLAGIEAAKTVKPNLILADMRLPDMNGEKMVPRIREADCCKDTPIIALTANTMRGDKEACLEAGCTDYLAKPVIRAELLNMIAHLLAAAKQSKTATDSSNSTYNATKHDKLSNSDKKDGTAE